MYIGLQAKAQATEVDGTIFCKGGSLMMNVFGPLAPILMRDQICRDTTIGIGKIWGSRLIMNVRHTFVIFSPVILSHQRLEWTFGTFDQ